jgi:hypothetical protein
MVGAVQAVRLLVRQVLGRRAPLPYHGDFDALLAR